MTLQDIITKTNTMLDTIWREHPSEEIYTVMLPVDDWNTLRSHEKEVCPVLWETGCGCKNQAHRKAFKYGNNAMLIAGDRYEAQPGVWVPE